MIEKRREELRRKHVSIISYFAGVFVLMILGSVDIGWTVEEFVAVYPIACVFFGAVLCLFAGLVLPSRKLEDSHYGVGRLDIMALFWVFWVL